jgi:hypothetical protein
VKTQREGIARDQAGMIAQLERFNARSIIRFSFVAADA